ncbi:MAG: sulfite exporter TauE/SafE family protein [Phycisphaerales bacterium]|nr:sulfite exporter TauE/SafE family protein [Phycisphaerales bacterium]
MLTPQRKKRLRQLWPWFLFLVIFYIAWAVIVLAGDHLTDVRDNWGIAVAMAAGSYFAGSTPMGGGTVGFPVLVLLFHQSADIGRHFSFAVQSIGMVSASIFILCFRQPVEWRMLRWAMLGSLIGTPFGAALIAPAVPQLFVKLLFAIIWCSFGIMHFIKGDEICRAQGIHEVQRKYERRIGLGLGLLAGATIASITGVGIDMVIYAVLVLLFRADLKIAVPTSVILMAFTSLVGIGANLALNAYDPATYVVQRKVLYAWLAAAPIVALGAPIGAFVVRRMKRKPTLMIVSALCVIQFIWTIVQEGRNMSVLAFVGTFAGLALFNAAFAVMYHLGGKKHLFHHIPTVGEPDPA